MSVQLITRNTVPTNVGKNLEETHHESIHN